MKFGVREIAEVVLRAKSKQKIGKRTFYRNDPVIYFDSLTTSSLEGAATTNYAQGGRGNARLMAWEGERTLTFNMTDALISPEGFMILSGAGLVEASASDTEIEGESVLYVHTTSQVEVKEANTIILPKLACWSHSGEMSSDNTAAITSGGVLAGRDYYHDGADIFIMELDSGEVNSEPCIPAETKNVAFKAGTADINWEAANIQVGVSYFLDTKDNKKKTKITCFGHNGVLSPGTIVLVDYYVKRTAGVKQIEITPDKFGGYFYLEGSTLFRRESDGKDLPAEIVIPKVKIQSNFTFTMASNGDPSTFDFVMDAFPDYTKFDGTKKVLAIMQIVEADDDDEAGEDFARRPHCQPLGDGTIEDIKWDDIDGHFAGYGNFNAYNKGYAYKEDDYASEDQRTKTLQDIIAAGKPVEEEP